MARLSDLYRRGKQFEISDDDGNSETVYIGKLNPVEAREAYQKANAAKARVLLKAKDEESDVWLDAYAELFESGHDELVGLCTATEVLEKRLHVEAELAAEPEWSDDSYLEGLKEAWEDELKMKWVSPDKDEDGNEIRDEEADRVYAEVLRFNSQVDKVMESEAKAITLPYQKLDHEALVRKAIEKAFEQQAQTAWIECYFWWRTFFSVRDPKKTNIRYFDSVAEVKLLEQETYTQLLEGYRSIEVAPLAVKGSEQTPTS